MIDEASVAGMYMYTNASGSARADCGVWAPLYSELDGDDNKDYWYAMKTNGLQITTGADANGIRY